MNASGGDYLPPDSYLGQAIAPSSPSVLTGYKTARLRMIDGVVTLTSITLSRPIKFEDDAQCSVMRSAADRYQQMRQEIKPSVADVLPDVMPTIKEHEVPSPDCTCGFYAYDNPDSAIHHDQNDPSCVMVEVAISGKYVAYESGYRYAHQRVKTIIIGACWRCGAQPTAMDTAEDGWMRGVCTRHASEQARTLEQISEAASDQVSDGYLPIKVIPGLSLPVPEQPSLLHKVTPKVERVWEEYRTRPSVMAMTAPVLIAASSVGAIIYILTS